MPVVGHRYKGKSRNSFQEILIKFVGSKYIVYKIEKDFTTSNSIWVGGEYVQNLESFLDNYEELPDSNLHKTEEVEVNESCVGKEADCKNCGNKFSQHHRGDYFCSNYCCEGLSANERDDRKKVNEKANSVDVEKKCSRCKITKNLSLFSKRGNVQSQISYSCKACDKAYKENSKNSNIYTYFIDVIRTSKQMHKKRKIFGDYEIDVKYLEQIFKDQNGLCAISKNSMTHISGSGQVPTNASIDRIDNKKGYSRDNIQLVCRCINSFKMNMSNEEAKRFLSRIPLVGSKSIAKCTCGKILPAKHDSAFCSSECRDRMYNNEDPKKSIWKDVNELHLNTWINVIVKYKDGEVELLEMFESLQMKNRKNTDKIIEFCTLTDFINSHEKMQRDIEELKRGK